jgi:hypothetical protein
MLCSVIFSQKMAIVKLLPEPPYGMAGYSNKMAEELCVYYFYLSVC